MGVIHGSARGRRGEALQQARCTTTVNEGELVLQLPCAEMLPLTLFLVSYCNRFGKMTYVSFAQWKPYGISELFFVQKL